MITQDDAARQALERIAYLWKRASLAGIHEVADALEEADNETLSDILARFLNHIPVLALEALGHDAYYGAVGRACDADKSARQAHEAPAACAKGVNP